MKRPGRQIAVMTVVLAVALGLWIGTEQAFGSSLARLGGLIYATAGTWVSVRVIRGVRDRRYDPFFAIFVVSAVVYLEIAPGLIVAQHRIGAYGATNLAVGFLLTPPTARQYLVAQTLVWLLLIAPLFLLYRPGIHNAEAAAAPRHRLAPSRYARFACLFSAALGILYLALVVKGGLLFRRLGPNGAISQLTGLSTLTYTVVRFYELGVFFLAAILIFLAVRSTTRRQRRTAIAALAVVSVTFMIPAIAESRLRVLLYLFAAGGWYLIASGARLRTTQWTRRASAFALIGLVLLEAVLNYRTIHSAELVHAPNPGLHLYSPLTGRGLHRLDGIDLIARLETPIAAQGPSNGRAWGEAPWIVGRRYVDPGGYRRFVATGDVTAKQYLTERYLGIQISDFYSSAMTDMFGNFWWFGLLFAALIFGLGYRWMGRRFLLVDAASAPALLTAMFFAAAWLTFEQEAVQLLSEPVTVAPLLVMFWILPPFRRYSVETPTRLAPTPTRLRTAI